MPGRIVTFEEFDSFRDSLGKIVCTSGGFDPIHPGHLSCITESKQFGDTLVIIVNGDDFLTQKKGKPFMDLETRARIVSYVEGVDYVIPFEIKNDHSVNSALERIRPHVFTKGGDRHSGNIPESAVIGRYHIEIISNVGSPKDWSSTNFLKQWGEFWKKNNP